MCMRSRGIPILIIDRAKLSADDSEHLLGVDLASGEVKWQQPALNDPVQVFPLYKSNRVLLIANEARFLDKPLLILLDPLTGHTDWTARGLGGLPSGGLQFWQWNDEAYLSNSWPIFPPMLGRVDLSTGKTLWSFRESRYQRPPVEGGLMLTFPAPQFAGGLVIFAAKDLVGLDPASGKAIWTAGDLGKIRGMQVREDLVLCVGDKGAFAVDPARGDVKWRVASAGRTTNLFYLKKQKILGFCDRSDFVTVDASTGKVIRRSPHHLGAEPKYVTPVGEKCVLVEGDEKDVLLNIDTGEVVESLPRPDGSADSLTFMLSQIPFDFLEKLGDGLPKGPSNNGQESAVDPPLARLESFATIQSVLLFKQSSPDLFDYWLVNGKTGEVKKFRLAGAQPNVNPSLSLIYLVQGGEKLIAAKLPAN